MSYKKVGAIRFVKFGRFGFSFWLAKQPSLKRAPRTVNRVPLRDAWSVLRQGV